MADSIGPERRPGSESRAGVGKHGHEPCSLDGGCQSALLPGGGAKSLSRVDFPVGGHHPAKHFNVLLIDVETTVGAGLHLELGAGGVKLGHIEATSVLKFDPGRLPGNLRQTRA